MKTMENQSLKCFADKGRYCSVLTEKNCYKCSFYQTNEQLELGREKAEKRLQRLREEKNKF